MKVSRSALLPYSTEQMYRIVANISEYPNFLNWCEKAEVLDENKSIDDDTVSIVVAKLNVSYGALNIQFVTRNQNTPHDSIVLNLVSGPFSELIGLWQFQALSSDASKVSIEMDFDFDKSLSSKLFGKVFEKIIAMQWMLLKNARINCTVKHMHRIRVNIVYATSKRQWLREFIVARGTNAEELIIESQFLQDIDDLQATNIDELSIGVFSQRVALDYLLEEGDRLEIYRPLKADPKEVRRQLALLGKTIGKK